MTEFNIFALNKLSVTDERVKEIFKLHGRGAAINWHLLEIAKNKALERYPDDAETIIADYEREIYWTKKKLAKKGLLNDKAKITAAYDDSFDDVGETDESPWLGSEEGL